MIELFQLVLNGLVAGAVLAVPAIGLTMVFAVLRFPNFAIAGHMAVGAFAGYFANTTFGLPAVAALSAAFLVAGGAGIVSDHVALKTFRPYGALPLAIASIALNLIIENILRFSFGNAPKNYAIPLLRDWTFGPFRMGPQQIENAAIAIVTMTALFVFLSATTTGKAMRAVADNPSLADIKGIDPDRMARIANFLGMGMGGIGGMLIGLDTSVDPLVGFRAILSVFAAAVVGGLGSIPGAVVGAIAVSVAEELSLFALPATYKSVVGFLAILFVLSLRPRGLLGDRNA